MARTFTVTYSYTILPECSLHTGNAKR